jgi:hypothetical protein
MLNDQYFQNILFEKESTWDEIFTSLMAKIFILNIYSFNRQYLNIFKMHLGFHVRYSTEIFKP